MKTNAEIAKEASRLIVDSIAVNAPVYYEATNRIVLSAIAEAIKVSSLKLANRVVNYLFVNEDGIKADRLVLTSSDDKNLGGWCKASVKDAIIREFPWSTESNELKAERERAEKAEAACAAMQDAFLRSDMSALALLVKADNNSGQRLLDELSRAKDRITELEGFVGGVVKEAALVARES